MDTPPLIIYHANCHDGFCAAWVARKVFPEAEFIAAHHGDDPPDVTGREVYILDFSYDLQTIRTMGRSASSVTVIDHHKSAEECLTAEPIPNVRTIFDSSKSGARLTAEHLAGGFTHWLINYTEDRDLWRHKLLDTKEINAGIRSFPLDFQVWDEMGIVSGPEIVRQEGVPILRWQQQMVDRIVKSPHIPNIVIAGYTVPCVNISCLFSEVLAELAKDKPFAVAWFHIKGKHCFELRSNKDSNQAVDVSEIAKKFGGGGHRNAAGFQTIVLRPGWRSFRH